MIPRRKSSPWLFPSKKLNKDNSSQKISFKNLTLAENVIQNLIRAEYLLEGGEIAQ
jgi:hypothetical protein